MQSVTGLLWVVYALAVARVTGLITLDEITKSARDRVLARLDEDNPPRWSYLLTCPWCVSVWIAAATAPLAYWLGDSPWLLVPALALAMSQLTGMASGLGRSRWG